MKPGVWCLVLAEFGKRAITEKMLADPAQMIHEIKHQSHWIVGAVVVLCVAYFLVMRLTAPKKA